MGIASTWKEILRVNVIQQNYAEGVSMIKGSWMWFQHIY
jgi:hypothetical protein